MMILMNSQAKFNQKRLIVKKLREKVDYFCQPSSLLKPSSGTWFLGSPSFSDSGTDKSQLSDFYVFTCSARDCLALLIIFAEHYKNRLKNRHTTHKLVGQFQGKKDIEIWNTA